MDVALKIDRLVKKYEKFSLKEVSFKIPRGYIMGFIGRNGAGKTTVIKCIMDLIPFEAGSIEVFGLDSRRCSHEIRKRVGYVSEDQYFYENMTAGWNLDFFGSFYPNRDRDLVLSLMKKFDIDPSKKVSELSKGMKVKLALALALAHRPELLILDEPTSGLDPVIRNELLELLLEVVQDENCSIFFSSHITSDIEKIADFVTFIEDGRVVISDEKDAILDKWRLFKVENSCSIAGLSERLAGVKKGKFGFSGITDNPESFIRELTCNYPDARYKVEKLSLDDLLVRIVREEEANEE